VNLPTEVGAERPATCPNCGEAFAGWHPQRRPRYCPACGQETRVLPPRLGEFIQQFGGAYLATEGALWRTLALLLFKPGELTARYLAGRRKHYVLPLRLYLTISVLTLLLMRLAGDSAVRIDAGDLAAVERKQRSFAVLTLGDGSGAGLRNGVFYCDKLPAWVCRRLQRRIDIDPKAVAGEIEQFKDRFVGNLGGAMFFLLPSFALWLKLAYRSRRMRYTEHLVFALHLHAFWFAALWLTLPTVPWLSGVAMCAVPWYTLAAMKRVYGGRRGPRLLRAMTVSVLYGLTLGIAFGGVAIWTLLA
jgi:hypothetical protein